jgi:putative ABC transport system permease protein
VLPDAQYKELRKVVAFFESVVQGLETTAGIEAAGVMSQPPGDLGPIPRTSFVIEGRTVLRPESKPTADLQTISPGYLKALRLPVRQGRALRDDDGAEAPKVTLVSESLAERFWPGEDPVGRRVRIGDSEEWRTVVGVVGDVKQYWFDREPRSTLYVPQMQWPRHGLFVVVRSGLDTKAIVAAARAAVRAADPNQPLDEIRTMATVVSESASFIRLAAGLMTTLGLVAVLLASVGLHGVMAEHVNRRTHEIGLRMALGAHASDVLRLVVGQIACAAGLGLILGIVGALALGRVMASVLFGVVRADALTLGAAALVLASVALAAAWVPARRAVRVDPLLVLREE